MKLVRDKVPATMQAHGEYCTVMQISVDDALYQKMLMQKLLEEVNEFAAAGDIAELADVLEVLEAIMKQPQYFQVRSEQADKAARLGTFKKGFIVTS